MADNFPQTPGSGRSVATDQVTYSGDTADVQLVRVVNTSGAEGSRVVIDKPVFQTEDSAHVDGDLGVLMMGVRNHVSGSTADGDYAAVSVSSTGDLHTISRRDMVRIAANSAGLTIATTAYAAGDQCGTLFTLANAARITGGSGVITGVRLTDVAGAAGVIGAMDVVFFDSTVTLAADNAAFAISDADCLRVIAVVQLAGAFALTNNRICQAFNLSIPYVCSGGTSLFAALITRSAHTFFTAVTDLQLAVTVDRY